jgi:hypothetical protein
MPTLVDVACWHFSDLAVSLNVAFAPEAARQKLRGELGCSAAITFARDRATRRAGWRRIPYGRTPYQPIPVILDKGLLIGQKKPLEPKHV